MRRIVVGVICSGINLFAATRAMAVGEGAVPTLELQRDIEEVHRIDAELSALEREVRTEGHGRQAGRHGQAQLLVRAAHAKQSAIANAIAAYHIDVRRVAFGVVYSPRGKMRERDAATYVDGDGTVRVAVSDAAFASAAWLGSTIAHEVEVHVDRHIAEGSRGSADEQEVEAYDHELANAARFGLTPDEIAQVKRRRGAHYRRLAYEARKRADDLRYARK